MTPKTPIRVETARLKDLPAILAIEEDSFSTDRFTKQALRRAIVGGKGETLVARLNGESIGYAILHFREGSARARVYSLAVSKSAQGQGVGAALVAAAKRRARARGRTLLSLEARADNNAAIALYARAGFVPVSLIRDYYEDGGTALRMELRLSGQLRKRTAA